MAFSSALTPTAHTYILAQAVEEFRQLDEKMRLFEEMMHELETKYRMSQVRQHIQSLPYEQD